MSFSTVQVNIGLNSKCHSYVWDLKLLLIAILKDSSITCNKDLISEDVQHDLEGFLIGKKL